MTEQELKKVKKDYMQGLKYKDIQEKHNITDNQLRYLIQSNKWKRKSNRSKVQKGNQNAKGNKGGPGAGKKNQNAVKTGEYQTIYDDLLTDEEKQILKQFEMEDKKTHILSELKILTIRERRIFKRIQDLQKGKDLNITRITKCNSQGLEYKTNGTSTTTEAESTINITQKLEEALTRIQEAKRRYLDSYHKIENDNRKLELELIRLEMEAAKDDSSSTEDIKDDSFIKALNESAEEVWDDYVEDGE